MDDDAIIDREPAVEPAVDPLDRLGEWLATRLPDATDVTITGLRKPEAGMSSQTVLATVHWYERGQPRDVPAQTIDIVVRAAPVADGPFPHYDMAVQAGIMRQLRAHTDVPVPEVLWLEQDPSWIGTPFLVMRAVTGEPLLDWPSYQAEGIYRRMGAGARRRLWEVTIDALASIHAVDWRAAGLDFVPGGRAHEDPARYQLQYWRRFLDVWIKDDPSDPIAVYDEVIDWLEQHRPDCPRPTLVWGDAKLGNVLYHAESGEVQAVLDWEVAMIGDPQVDLASLRVSDIRAQQGAGGRALPGTPTEDELIAHYERATGDTIRDWRWAMLYSCFWRGAVALKVMRRMREQGRPISDQALAEHFPVALMRDLLAG